MIQTKLIYLIAPLLAILLAIMGLVFQLNRQFTEEQQIIVSRNAHASVRHSSQLLREHLRFFALIQAENSQADHSKFQLQWDLVWSRVRILETTLRTVSLAPTTRQRYENYAKHWNILQPKLTFWTEHPDGNEVQHQILEQMTLMEQDINQLVAELQFHFEDEMQHWANQSQFLNYLLTGSSLGFIAVIGLMLTIIFRFIQTQVANEQSLRDSEQRLRAILDALPDAVYRVRRDGIYTDYKPAKDRSLNGVTCDASSYPAFTESFCGKHITQVLPIAIADIFTTGVERVLEDDEELLVEYELPSHREQSKRSFEARFLPSGQEEVQIIIRDITEAKQEEEADLQAQKMESLGVLAGGIAHDFNNLLTGMLGQASLAVSKSERGLPATQHLNKIVVSAERAADLTRQLLAYTGKGKFQIAPLRLNQLIEDTTGLMETVLPNRVNLILNLDEQLPAIEADRGQIQQVIMNLFINAIEALEENHGTITIATSCQEIDETASVNHNAPHDLQPGNYVVISVADTGMGMEQTTLSRIFDPFFSTKVKGHGLGLSAIMGIIRMHRGTLTVQSQIRQGTTFTVWLPALSQEQLSVEPIVKTAPSGQATSKQMVLIIDDEEFVREAISDILTTYGFTVISAANGHEGIELFNRSHSTIGVTLLDLKMPGIDGKETFHALHQIQPNLKVIFTSGYSESELGTDVDFSNRIAFLPKPYNAAALTQQIQQMLTLA